LVACALIAIGATPVNAKSAGRKDSGVAYVSIVRQAGGLEYAAGYGNDKLFGAIAVTYVVSIGPSGPGTFKINARKVTFYTSNGSLWGTGSATQTVTATSSNVTDGKVSLTHGGGAQAGHGFTGTFSGPFDTQTTVYTFHYTGTYK
jgi:hypothetical protein